MAYTSKIDLGGLGEQPKTTNPDVFGDMVDIVNAIHILAQWVSSVLPGGGGGSGVPPAEAMRFLRSFQMPALVDITAGDLITVFDARTWLDFGIQPSEFPFPADHPGVIKGGGGRLEWAGQIRGGITGFALNGTTAGNMVDIGIGPAIVNVQGAKAGLLAFARTAFSNNNPRSYFGNGAIFLDVWNQLQDPHFQVIGVGVGDDLVMIGAPPMTIPNYLEPSPPDPGTGGDGD